MIITGGAGFIGGHLAKRLPKAEMWDRKLPDHRGIQFYGGHETIIHLAASTYLTEGYDRQIIDDNIVLCDNIRRHFYISRIVYASSAAVYNLNNIYAYSKKYAEDLFAPYNATGLRYYNVYGPNDNGVVGKLIRCAMTGEPFHLNGGHQVRDFIYIDDVVQATINAIDSRDKIIEIGTGIGTSIYNLIRMVERIIGKRITIIPHDLSSFETLSSICPKPIKSFTPLEEGLKRTIEYYL